MGRWGRFLLRVIILIPSSKIVDREMGRWGDGGDGEMGRWGDGEMGRWGDGEMGRFLLRVIILRLYKMLAVECSRATVNSQPISFIESS
ncbi:MAG: hypothetical protein F6J90_34625 [Moorea sp. SIOASIH]|uniref:hypothetical protein n=1 Tax=Moorena sp. SIOASIH TaxID=2607817 RepID=UPI0013BAFF76|nr:hypothetical protein [Moorena sp. SIOASIH]NEO41186.1 hypothetical protein [Moorena sp. SIOASIH]